MTSWTFSEVERVLMAFALIVLAIVAMWWLERKRTRG